MSNYAWISAAIFGPGGPIVLLLAVRGDHFRGWTDTPKVNRGQLVENQSTLILPFCTYNSACHNVMRRHKDTHKTLGTHLLGPPQDPSLTATGNPFQLGSAEAPSKICSHISAFSASKICSHISASFSSEVSDDQSSPSLSVSDST